MKQEPVNTLFARQAIYDVSGSVCAYELLYREDEQSCANIDSSDTLSGDKATSFIISHLFTDSDIEAVTNGHLVYINFTRSHLLQKIPALLPKERIVIEILEDIVIDELLLKSVQSLSKQGYKLALDDFVFSEELLPLINLANIIKIDVLNLNEQEIRKQLTLLAEFKGHLLAEKIENREQLLLCKELGFQFFQGFFLNYPDLVSGQKMSENKTHLLKLLAELHNPEVKIQRIEEIILQIPKLSYRILRLAKSATLYSGKKIESLMEAIQKLGLVQIRTWISLILISSLDEVNHDLLERTLIRAKMCQILARISGKALPHQAYTVGMLSTLDAILNESMSSLLSKIQLSDELNEALLSRDGELGHILALTHHYEQANFDRLEDPKLTTNDYSQAYLQGIAYANNVMEILR